MSAHRSPRHVRKISKKTQSYFYSMAVVVFLLAVVNLPVTSAPSTEFVKSAVTTNSDEAEVNNEDQSRVVVQPVIKSPTSTVVTITPGTLSTPVQNTPNVLVQEQKIKSKLESPDVATIAVSVSGGQLAIKTTDKAGVVTTLADNQLQSVSLNVTDKGQTVSVDLQVKDNKFYLQSQSVAAMADFPLILNKDTGLLEARTSVGDKSLAVLPDSAKKIADQQGASNTTDNIILTVNPQQSTGDDLYYSVLGKHSGLLLGIIPLTANIETDIGATTGKVLQTKEPLWFKLFGFLMT